MAIRLASAIGQQREPIGILGGVDDAINKTGDAIQADQLRKSEAAAKKKDQEQRMKDAILGRLDVTTLEDVHPDDRAEDVNYKKEQFAKIAIASHDPNVTSSQLQQMHRDYIQGAKDREYLYKRDWEKARALEKARKEGYLTKDMDMFLAGQTEQQNTPTQISKSQENGGIGVPTQEEALGSTQFTGTPYFKKPIEERLKTNIDEEFDKRVVMPTLGALEAVKDINGKEFSPNDFVTRTVNKEGGWDYFVDKAKLENEAQKYAIHMTGNTNYGKRQNQTKTAMEKEAYMALRNAGLSDDEIAAEMPNVVKQLAYDDFMRKVQHAIDGELTRQKEEPLRREGKGIVINNGNGSFSNGNTSMDKADDVTPYIKRKYAEKEAEIKREIDRIKEIGSADPRIQQTLKAYEKNLSDLERLKASESQTHIKYSNAKAKDDQFVDYTNKKGEIISFRPEDFYKNNGKWFVAGEQRTKDADGKVIYTNAEIELNENNYRNLRNEDKLVIPLLEKHGIAPNKKEGKGAEKTQPKDYGTRPDGTKKGKGYFGELKMEDGSGSVATEISMNFDDVLGGALIPSLVPTLTESEKKHLLKGNKATKEIQLKAIKHAEERASKGLSPFVDGGELKSKSGKPIYWDKTAKTYKYK